MDALNHPRPETTFQSSQSPLTDADRFVLEQMIGLLSPGLPDTLPARVDTPDLTREGGRSSGGIGGGGSGSGGGGEGSDVGSSGGEGRETTGAGSRRSTHYPKAESIAVARAWDAVTSEPIVGTDQAEPSFWKSVQLAYKEFKPRGAKPHDEGQLLKKCSRILSATKRFAGIYENNLLTAESGRSKADVKAQSMS